MSVILPKPYFLMLLLMRILTIVAESGRDSNAARNKLKWGLGSLRG